MTTKKAFLLATIDFTNRMQNGETIALPPVLNESSRIHDFEDWLKRPDMFLPEEADKLYAKIIGYTKEAVTAIVWIKESAPHEVHADEYEKFLIVEGTCDIIVENEVHSFVPGDYFAIPLHKSHNLKVTSQIPCKVILQRIAA